MGVGFILNLLLSYGLRILLVFLVLVVLKLVYKAVWEKMYLPPGPYGLPLIGYIPFFPNPYNVGTHFLKLQKKYKGDCLTVNLGEHQVVLLNSWAAIDQALRHPYMAGRPDNRLRRLWVECGQDSMFLNQGPSWAFTRRIGIRAIAIFTSSRNSKMGQACEIVARWLTDEFGSKNGEPTETKNLCYQACAAVTGAMTFGFEPAPHHPFLEKLAILEEEFDHVAEGQNPITMFFPSLEFLDKKQARKERDALYNVLDHVRTWVKQYKPKAPGEIHNLMDAVNYAVKEVPEEEKQRRELTDEKIHAMIFDLFEAPAASLSEAFMWTLLSMSKFRDAQAKVQEEVDFFCGKDQPTLDEHHPHLIYTRAVLQENWRWNSAWVFEGMQRATTEDVWFRGHWLPKGTAYWANVWAIHFDPEMFPDPDKFLPERYIKADGTFDQDLAHKVQNFGMGTRRCIGETFTIQLLVIMLATILQKYDILPDPYQKGDPLRDIDELGFDFVPGPHKLIFRPRSEAWK